MSDLDVAALNYHLQSLDLAIDRGPRDEMVRLPFDPTRRRENGGIQELGLVDGNRLFKPKI